MAHYRKIDARIWNDEKFCSLNERGKLVFFFVLTHPNQTMIGAMRGTIPGLASELFATNRVVQPTLKGFTDALSEGYVEAFFDVSRKGMVRYDEKACLIWLPNFLKYNPPESPNVVKAWPRVYDLLPECEMRHAIFQRLKDFSEGYSEAFSEAFYKAFPKDLPKTYPNQEQEQEQKQEQIKIKSGSSEPDGSKPSGPANGAVKVLINLPMLGKKEFPIDQHQVEEWERLYPAVDVIQELRKMRGWLLANPDKRKIKVIRFANTWLAKEQDRAPARPSTPKNFTHANPDAEIPWPEKSQGEKGALVNLWTRDVRGGWEKMSDEERGKRVRLLVENYPFVLPEQWPKWMQPHLAASKKARA